MNQDERYKTEAAWVFGEIKRVVQVTSLPMSDQDRLREVLTNIVDKCAARYPSNPLIPEIAMAVIESANGLIAQAPAISEQEFKEHILITELFL